MAQQDRLRKCSLTTLQHRIELTQQQRRTKDNMMTGIRSGAQGKSITRAALTGSLLRIC
jgi:hypothetical protein